MNATFYGAKKSVKKRIKETNSANVVEQEEECNIFDMLEYM